MYDIICCFNIQKKSIKNIKDVMPEIEGYIYIYICNMYINVYVLLLM